MSLLARCTCPDNGVFDYSPSCPRHGGIPHPVGSLRQKPPMNNPYASPMPVSDRAENWRQAAMAFERRAMRVEAALRLALSELSDQSRSGYLQRAMDVLRAESVPAQLGTGSGAGAQSDSGADSGHATSAVPCLHTSVSEAETLDAQLCKFYGVSTFPELVAAMERHIEKLQAKLPPSPSLAPQQVRQG